MNLEMAEVIVKPENKLSERPLSDYAISAVTFGFTKMKPKVLRVVKGTVFKTEQRLLL